MPGRLPSDRKLQAAPQQKPVTDVPSEHSRRRLPAVTLAIQTGLRDEELRLLKWRQLDLLTRTVTVGKSKTEHGTGRVVPLNKVDALPEVH